jgi:hypothetical protein
VQQGWGATEKIMNRKKKFDYGNFFSVWLRFSSAKTGQVEIIAYKRCWFFFV